MISLMSDTPKTVFLILVLANHVIILNHEERYLVK